MIRLTSLARNGLSGAALPARAMIGRLRQYGPRPPRFAGAYGSVAEALAAVPPGQLAGYDHEAATEVSFEAMTQVHLWDYPVLFWLDRVLAPGMTVLDAGGHLATKHTAFRRFLHLSGITWAVLDLPAIVQRGRRLQAEGHLPASVQFHEDPSACPAADVLLASGLLQYLEQPLADLVDRLAQRPSVILLNKVATRDGPEVVTLERIGPTRVAYRIRNHGQFKQELRGMNLHLMDEWVIPGLGHRIATHPGLGTSISRGFALSSHPPKAVR
ncbi:methyltransferase, TIGR04325 family [Cereibacter sediminicola]|uniref:methyltransferase, TIGR04325 family n=1 Tax=Cereibacter sediminicola TaxID=2584941 RepID=UPI0016431466|nr:methyltransferase, TIGR04325 family [Cereibacter sediminicola]